MANCVSALRVLSTCRRYSAAASGPKSAPGSCTLFLRARSSVARSSASIGDLLKRLCNSWGGTRSRTYLARTAGWRFREWKFRSSSRAPLGLLAGTVGTAAARGATAPRPAARCGRGRASACSAACGVGAAATAWAWDTAGGPAGSIVGTSTLVARAFDCAWRRSIRACRSVLPGCCSRATSTSCNADFTFPSSARAKARR
mmetsp:Transcript_823/g.2602  ORF Transcript_823/g.2602 Transcript_823/m.2602 type:complete len:201 (+) Transcript_823:237-839(+)